MIDQLTGSVQDIEMPTEYKLIDKQTERHTRNCTEIGSVFSSVMDEDNY